MNLVTFQHSKERFGGQRICIVTGHSNAEISLAKNTTYSVLFDYAAYWGHDVFVLRGKVDGFYPIVRLQETVRLLDHNKYDWAFVVDSDVMITNFSIPLFSLIEKPSSFVIGTDCNGWNAGSMLVANVLAATEFIELLSNRHVDFKDSTFKEQDAMTALAPDSLFSVLPQRRMNSFNYDLYPARGGKNGIDVLGNDGQWQPGDLLIHWAGLPMDVRVREAEKMLPQIQR